uniref:Tumor necrosis factor receptor superfamily member 18-like n=1 Tax=Sinocyclocheilus anshuiensis TaxID=1608454 RepID=A0A671NSJ4_9TELE
IYHCDTMDTAKLWFMLLCVCGGWILSLAYIDCDWTTEYEYGEKCCTACPSDQYPKVTCSENKSDSVCEKCSTAISAMDKCFCYDNHVCSDDKCTNCDPRKKCKPGHQLKRNGAFDYTYFCEPCPENTYNDVEDSTCKSITKCAGGEIFPGNQTHNARCGSFGLYFLLLTCSTHTVMGLILSKLSCTHRMVLPSDTCSCKLSKEEEGEEKDSKTELSEVPCKHDVHRFP